MYARIVYIVSSVVMVATMSPNITVVITKWDLKWPSIQVITNHYNTCMYYIRISAVGPTGATDNARDSR